MPRSSGVTVCRMSVSSFSISFSVLRQFRSRRRLTLIMNCPASVLGKNERPSKGKKRQAPSECRGEDAQRKSRERHNPGDRPALRILKAAENAGKPLVEAVALWSACLMKRAQNRSTTVIATTSSMAAGRQHHRWRAGRG